MLWRKIDEELSGWKDSGGKRGLLVMGARQVGKTTAIREFAAKHYAKLAEVNFFENDRAVETVASARDAEDLFLRLSILAQTEIDPDDTLVFLDEIQECSDILTWIKFLVADQPCDFVLSGSRLGLDSFYARSLPVGYLRQASMYPMDFEEFCVATGVPSSAISIARDRVFDRRLVPDAVHDLLVDKFHRYLLVGGMPAAVQAYVDTNSLPNVRRVQQDVSELYRYDIGKYVGNKVEARQIRMVYDSIPGQLNHPNKRFKYTRLEKNLRFANLETSFDWLRESGVALETVRVGEPVYPLGLAEERSSLKLYMNDVGLLTERLAGDADIDLLDGRAVNFGSVYENAAAQELAAHGFELFYYSSTRVGEVDFVVQSRRGDVSLFEVKSGKDYRRHSALDNLRATENYGELGCFVLSDANVSVEDGVSYLPIYALMFADGLV